ncbi:MAG: hypothetical protein ACRDP7_13725 [Trebonia sp.]
MDYLIESDSLRAFPLPSHGKLSCMDMPYRLAALAGLTRLTRPAYDDRNRPRDVGAA